MTIMTFLGLYGQVIKPRFYKKPYDILPYKQKELFVNVPII